MKTGKFIFSACFIILISLFLCGFKYSWIRSAELQDINSLPGFPEEISKILIHSCYDCHSSESQSQIAKTILDFDKWDDFKTAKKINLLSKMDEAIKEKSMPPRKYINQNPEKILTQDQIDIFSKWATEESDKLMGDS